MRTLLVILACSIASAAPVIRASSVGPQSAVVQVRFYTGSCSYTLSQSSSLSPTITAYHPDDVTWTDGTINVALGRLTPNTAYYLKATCNAVDSNTIQFTTSTLLLGTTRTEPDLFDNTQWANWGISTAKAFDWTDFSQTYQDPKTGVVLKPLPANYYSARTGGTTAGQGELFANWLGGSGWTTPENIVSGSGTATVGNTNPLDLFANVYAANGGNAPPIPYSIYHVLQDFGVVPVCGGSSATAADRQLSLRLYVHGAAVGNAVTITCPQGSAVAVSSGSSDPDGAFPSAFPTMPFYGWSGSATPIIRMEDQETTGTATVSGSTVTISSPTKTDNFPDVLTSSDYIYLSGSSCTNNMCAISSVTDPTTLTTGSAPGDGSKTYRTYGWFLRVTKANATGTVTFSMKYKLAGSLPLGMPSTGDRCGKLATTSGDGKTGYPCIFTTSNPTVDAQAFVATDGTVRIYTMRDHAGFSDTDPKILYQGTTNGGGGYTVNKLTYSGDYTTSIDYGYNCTFSWSCPSVTDNIAVTDLMPYGSNLDLNQQITANWSGTYSQSEYGAWTVAGGGVYFSGVTGHYAIFRKELGGQDLPAWLAWVDVNTGLVAGMCHTTDGTGCPQVRFSGLHNSTAILGRDNTLFIAGKRLVSNNSAIAQAGPYRSTPDRVWRSGAWSSTTTLPWPYDATYDGTCPANTYGYDLTEGCVTVRMNLVCNIAPTVAEKAAHPCAWNASYSMPVTLAVGDLLYDASVTGDYDSEHFRVLSITLESGNLYRVVLARNAVWDYCSYTPWHGVTNPTSAQFAGQLEHSNGWTATAAPGNWNSCGDLTTMIDLTSGDSQTLGAKMIGHFEVGENSGSAINYVTQPVQLNNQAFSTIGQIPPPYINTTASFNGVSANIGPISGPQSYTDQSAWDLGVGGYNVAIDTNPFVAAEAEALGWGPVRTLTHVTGDIYTIASFGGGAQTAAGYKTNPLVGWAGRYQLQDLSGPSSSVDATPFSVCIVVTAGECHAGSSANAIYVNVPHAYDPSPGYCSASISWANIPCVMIGNNAPAGGLRQFKINTSDPTGANSRMLGIGWASIGRQYPYTHGTMHPSGKWVVEMPSNIVDGFMPVGFLVQVPEWQGNGGPSAFQSITVKAPSGSAYAEVRFGYNSSLQCTPGAWVCASGGTPYHFTTETRTLTSCTSGCTLTVPAVLGKTLYYQVWRGAASNGSDAAASGEVQVLEVR